jgi:multidrug efflux pump subunit AcrA (membrane-fusion protein)
VITPKTPAQQGAQNAMKTLSTAWSALTAAQRSAWKVYAQNVPTLNRVGESRVIPELSHYIRSNSPRLQAVGSAAVVSAAPTTFALAVLTSPVLTATHPTAISIAYTNTDAWAVTTGGYLIVQISRPVSPTRIFPKARFTILGTVAGNTGTPPTSPGVFVTPYPLVAGQQVWIRVRASNSDGRLSSPQLISTIVV